MAVLIDMEMPRNCAFCMFSTRDMDCSVSERDVSAEWIERKRPSWCPLVEVKTPQKTNTKLLEESGFEL